MKKRILAILTATLALQPLAWGQVALRDAFANAPDNLFPLLTRNNILGRHHEQFYAALGCESEAQIVGRNAVDARFITGAVGHVHVCMSLCQVDAVEPVVACEQPAWSVRHPKHSSTRDSSAKHAAS